MQHSLPVNWSKQLPFWVVLLFCQVAYPWGAEHRWITREAVACLPASQLSILKGEKAALIDHYCEFPDLNWITYGQWGGGVADPSLPRLPDLRREWGVSAYCGWNPYLRTGKSYPHRTPEAYEAVSVHFLRAAKALQEGRNTEAMRIAGVMLHYIQDSGSLPMLQPIHRRFHFEAAEMPVLTNYTPVIFADSPEACATEVSKGLEIMVKSAQAMVNQTTAKRGLPIDEAIGLCAKDLVSPKVGQFTAKWIEEDKASFSKCATGCADLCSQLCADTLASLLQFADPLAETAAWPIDSEAIANPSFENDEDGDEFPDGWCVGWNNLKDNHSRVTWYKAGTHWERPIKSGVRSLLIRYPSEEGIEIRQSWPAAPHVNEGEVWQAKIHAMAKPANGEFILHLKIYDDAYHEIDTASTSVSTKSWDEIKVQTTIPENAHWLRLVVVVNKPIDNAFWIDSASLKRLK